MERDEPQSFLNNPHTNTTRSTIRSRDLVPHEFGRGPRDRAQSSEPYDIQRIITYRRLYRRFNNLPVHTSPSSRRTMGEVVLASSAARSRSRGTTPRSTRAEAAAAPDLDFAAAAVHASLSSPSTMGEIVLASSVERSRSWGATTSSASVEAAAAPESDVAAPAVHTSPSSRRTMGEVVLASSAARSCSWGATTSSASVEAAAAPDPDVAAPVACTSPSLSRTMDERVLASSVERSRSWGAITRSARVEAAAAPDPDVAAPDNTPNVSPDGVPLDTIVETDEEPDENQNGNNADQSHNLDHRNANNKPDRSGSTAESSQRRGVKRRRDCHGGYSEIATFNELNQSLLNLLECPVCLEWIEPPVPQCQRGHLVCSRCRARLASCPLCRTTFSSMRNRAMEEVADMLRYPCRRGCGREVRLRLRAQHEAGCAARRYRCPAPACARRPRLSHHQLHLHLQSEHRTTVRRGCRHTFSVNVDSERLEHWLVWALGEVFHVRVVVDARTCGVVVLAAYVGPRCNARRYKYRITVEGLSDGQELVYTRSVYNNLERYNPNLSLKNCFHLSFDQALHFIRVGDERCDQACQARLFTFTIEIIESEAAQNVLTPVQSSSYSDISLD